MGYYKNVESVYSSAKENNIVSLKKLNFFSVVFVFILTFGVLGLSLSSLKISNEVKLITSNFSPSGIGKLKYVDVKNEQEAFLFLEDISMPFLNSFASEEKECFLVDGLGGMVVKACMSGVVEKIENNGDKKTVKLSHGKGLVSIYEMIDNVGAKKGDKLEKNDPIGISYSSLIKFRVLFKNKLITGLTIKDGELVFD